MCGGGIVEECSQCKRSWTERQSVSGMLAVMMIGMMAARDNVCESLGTEAGAESQNTL